MLNSSSSSTPSFRDLDTTLSNTTNAGVMMSINLVTFLSFCWYFLVRAEIIPLAIAPVRDAAPNGMLTGKPMNVANVTTLDIPVATIIADTLGIRGLREMGYNITKTNLKPKLVLDLLEKQAELPSSSEIAKADETELEEIAEKALDLIFQIKDVQTDTDDLFEHPL